MATTTMTFKMKLFIDTKEKRVLFAEADEDVVDFLLSLLDLPVATIVKMLGKESMSGSIGNLYAIVEKKALLQPAGVVPSAVSSSHSSLLLPAPSSGQTKNLFKCRNNMDTCNDYVTDSSGVRCPSCGMKMRRALKYVAPPAEGSGQNVEASSGAAKGFVQGVVTYMVRDNLTVVPMSTSSMTLVNRLGLTDLSALQEKTVQLGYSEFLHIIKSSMLATTTVLTDIFLSKKRPRTD